MSLKSQIPNSLTLSNLILGVVAICFASMNRTDLAAWCILGAAGFDFLDGLVARALGVTGELGKQLDSLADMVSFGVAPVFIALQFNGVFNSTLDFSWNAIVLFTPVIMAALSAYRLGKFNIDTRQVSGFLGMPTPANALFWISIALAGQGGIFELAILDSALISFRESSVLIAVMSVILGVLMVSEIPLIALKFGAETDKKNVKIGLVFLSMGLFILLSFSAIPIILLLYLILSFVSK